jgi:hypothetical protein
MHPSPELPLSVCLSRHCDPISKRTHTQRTVRPVDTTHLESPTYSPEFVATDHQTALPLTMADSNAPKPSSSVKLVLLGEAAVGKVGVCYFCPDTRIQADKVCCSRLSYFGLSITTSKRTRSQQ